MSMVGTFDAFTASRLGIYAAQHGLRVTGNNISNINTSGYTRQRVDQYSLKVGASDMYRSLYDNHIGSGALVKGINQIRDPYLDIRYRSISTETYHQDTWLAGLQGIASILDEVGKGENDGDGLLYAQLQDFAEKLRTYGSNPTTLNERLVRNAAASLTALFNSAAEGLEREFNETKAEFFDNIDAVNEILTNIRDLNKSIRAAEIHGDTALEMRDERNRQIDALSQYLDISVEYSFEDVGGGIQVEKLTIKLDNANPDKSVKTDESILVDGLYATQLSVPDEKPALNVFPSDSKYAYLNKFLYRRAVTEDAAKELGYDDPDNQLAKDENGLYLIGTNDADLDGVVMETNNNYSIQLSQLVNEKGAPWKNSTTRWTEVEGTRVPAQAKFSYSVKGNFDPANDAASNTFKIGTTTYTVGTDLTFEDANNPITFAKFVADKLEKTGNYTDYTVSDDGKGNIIFTAKNEGTIGSDTGPKDYPQLSVNDPDLVGTIILLPMQTDNPGYTIESPADPNVDYPLKTYDEHGNVIRTVDYVQVEGRWYEVQIDTEYTHNIALDDNDLHGILQAQRELLTEEGEFSSEYDVAIDENALTKRGIPYYMKSLDLLAQKFAEAYNQLNHGYAYNQDGNYIREDGTELTMDEVAEDGTITYGTPISAINGLTEGQKRNLVNNGLILADDEGYAIDENGHRIKAQDGEYIQVFDKNGNFVGWDALNLDPADREKLVADLETWLANKNNGAWEMGGVLFSNRGDGNDTSGITAKNISISADWSNGATEVIRTFEMLFKDDGSGGLTNSTQPSNINHMITMIEKSLTYDPRDLAGSDAIGPVLFEGGFNDMLSNMMAVEARDASLTSVRLTTAALRLDDLDYSREGVSGVDLNDEAMNMITYQKAMSAAMRLMTAIDEVLDRLINNTGVAGR